MFIYTLLSKKDSGRFPNDEEFSTALSTKQIYQMRGKYKAYLFERFENYGTVETKDVYTHLDNNVYTIEHIMPQHLTPAWIETLGENALEIHSTWLHRLANLTLTGYNKINDYAFAGNKFITDVVIMDDIARVESYVFKDVNLQSVTLSGDNAKDVFLDGVAFDANKNLKVFVPATNTREIRSWLSYSKNFIYSHNLLVHPVGCSNSQNHVHGIRSRAGATGSYEGYTYSINGTIISIDGDNGWLVTDDCPIYFR